MIDLRYHIASIVAVFLALGLGVLIGSSIVGDNLLVDQQKKMIDRLEEEFYVLREQEDILKADISYKDNIINNYENYSQAVLPLLVQGRLEGFKAAVVVTGDGEVPANMTNALIVSGAEVVSKVVVLANINLESPELQKRLIEFYNLDSGTERETLRHYVAVSVAAILNGLDDPGLISFLEQNNLIKFSGDTGVPVNGVIILGGANSLNSYFAPSFDRGLVSYLNQQGVNAYGVEHSQTVYSYMDVYQNNNISTIDNIDISTGQIALILAMEGEAGNYGIKPSAKKFMPSLPIDTSR